MSRRSGVERAGPDAGCVAAMIGAVRCAVLVSVAAAFPALAQTAATPGSVTSSGVVTLGTGTSGSAESPTTSVSPAAAATASTTTGGSSTGSAGAAPSTNGASGGSSGGGSGGRSSAASNTGSTSSASAASGGSSGSPVAAPSSSVPSWVLCPPSGASGMQAFLAGTDLSCAP